MSDKPWDQEWEAIERNRGKWSLYPTDGSEEEFATFWDDDPGRIKLVAAAPDLYRALVLAEWGGDNEWCDACKQPKIAGHELDCPVAAALKKARGET